MLQKYENQRCETSNLIFFSAEKKLKRCTANTQLQPFPTNYSTEIAYITQLVNSIYSTPNWIIVHVFNHSHAYGIFRHAINNRWWWCACLYQFILLGDKDPKVWTTCPWVVTQLYQTGSRARQPSPVRHPTGCATTTRKYNSSCTLLKKILPPLSCFRYVFFDPKLISIIFGRNVGKGLCDRRHFEHSL